MSADLRVALSDLPGFDPVGLRVLDPNGELGSYVATYADEVHVMLDGRANATGGLVLDEDVDLDLSDAATRDRLARWLAARVGLEVGCTAPRWFWHVAMRCWVLGHGRLESSRSFSFDGRVTDHEVPPLSDLDGADDDTRLPDGSRLVDAVALARVAVHVGGAS